jgi:UDP-N-acetylglucosamine 2-epimerase (non-hydrolysing)
MGNIISKAYEIMRLNKPDALLILGDTNSALSAISAKRLKIPIFHMEAGNRCFDENLPEETNRKIVDHISDINLPIPSTRGDTFSQKGLRRRNIYVTGSPMREVAAVHRKKS